MIDRQKVIKALELCREGRCHSGCPYNHINVGCRKQLDTDAIALLKEQEVRVMTLDELTGIYVEFKGNVCPIRLSNFDLQKIIMYADSGVCRLWTGKPTGEQMEATKWE
jgi:hypothetical protein